jgi:hypothetical protein
MGVSDLITIPDRLDRDSGNLDPNLKAAVSRKL